MSADPKDLFDAVGQLTADALRPFPGSRKINVPGSRPDIRVGMREIGQTATPMDNGPEPSPPLLMYDTSGPDTDPDIAVDLLQGVPPMRNSWIEEHNDSDLLERAGSEYGLVRETDRALKNVRLAGSRSPRRARGSANVSQMHYARNGIITPEMEYVAIRENLRVVELREHYSSAGLLTRHGGEIYEKR